MGKPVYLIPFFLSVVLTLIMLPQAMHAEDYAIHIMSDKKVLRAEMLRLPGNTTLQDALNLLPEFLGRDGNEIFAGYDIMLDGNSLGGNRNIVLMNTLMYDIKEIEISDSPTASQQRNGPAGVVNIKTKAAGEGLSGTTNLSGTTEWDVASTTTLKYKKGKIEINGLLGLNYYRPKDCSVFEKMSDAQYVYGSDTVVQNNFQQNAMFNLKYKPGERDQIRLRIIEDHVLSNKMMYETNSTTVYRDDLPYEKMYGGRLGEVFTTSFTKPGNSRKTNLDVLAEYIHTLKDKSFFRYSANYVMSKSKGSSIYPTKVLSSISYTTSSAHACKFKGGADLTYRTYDILAEDNSSIYVSPYLNFDYNSSKLSLNAGIRYQYFRMFSTPDHDVSANLNVLWQFRPHDALRLIATRNLIRPSAEKLFPQLVWNQDRESYTRGNPNLHQTALHNVTVDYIFDRTAGNAHFVTNVSTGYYRVDGLVEETVKYDEAEKRFFLTYENLGVNNILMAKANAVMSVGIFALSLSGNVFCNIMESAGNKDAFSYFNLGLTTLFNFNKGWSMNAHAMYNSKVVRNNNVLGDCLLASVSVNKTLGNWDFKATLSDVFDYYTSNYNFSKGTVTRSAIDLYTRYFGLGVTYRFGH